MPTVIITARRAPHTSSASSSATAITPRARSGGQPVRLELWEKAMLAAIFGFVDMDGNRQYREALLIVGKKNGKSLLASAVGLYLMIGDGEPGPEVYAVAATDDSGRKSSGRKPSAWCASYARALKAYQDPDPRADQRGVQLISAVFKPLASDSDTLDGLNVHGVRRRTRFTKWEGRACAL